MNLLLEAAAASLSAANLSCASTEAATSGWLGTTDWGRWGAVGWKPAGVMSFHLIKFQEGIRVTGVVAVKRILGISAYTLLAD